MTSNAFTELQNRIGYQFQNQNLLINALTHSSYANEATSKGELAKSNERLEFLGDSVLSLIVSRYLFEEYPDLPEGDLSKIRAQTVCEKTLAAFSRQIHLGDHLLLGHGEQQNKGNERDSILADAFEALLAAIYLDGGYEEARRFVMAFIEPEVKNIRKKPQKDYKTTLQEIVQKNPGEKLEYRLVSESGPDHNKHFVAEVLLNSNSIGKGGGRSKKEAEQQAARAALELMGY